MEKLLNQYDKEYMKMAMLKHEETFREQVYELHRLYRIQKTLMKDMAHYINEGEVEANYGVFEDDQLNDLELTLGPRSYSCHKKIIKAGGGRQSSSSSGSKGSAGTSSHEFLKWGPSPTEMVDVSINNNQDRLNTSPWLFQALTLNIT